MSGIEGFAGRLRRAFRAWEDRMGRDATQTELGELVGEAMGEEAISQQSVARWFAGTLPEHPRMVALARVLGVDPGWLSYGSGEDDAGNQPAMPNVPPRVPQNAKRIEPSDPPPGVVVDAPARRPVGKRRPGDRTALAS